MSRIDPDGDHGYGGCDRTEPPSRPEPAAPADPVTSLERLEELHRAGRVTDAEFSAGKAHILGLSSTTGGSVTEPPRTRLVFKVLAGAIVVLIAVISLSTPDDDTPDADQVAATVADLHDRFGSRPEVLEFALTATDCADVVKGLQVERGRAEDPTYPANVRDKHRGYAEAGRLRADQLGCDVPAASPGATPVDHTRRGTKDVSTGSATRYVTSVQVEPGTSHAQLVTLSEWLVASHRATGGGYDALALQFYDTADTDGIPALGMAEDAPHGDWSRPAEAADNYATHRLDTSRLREMDWTKRPTDAQRDAHDLNAHLERRASSGDTSIGDLDWRIAEIARVTGQSTDQVRAGIDAVMAWELGFDGVTLD